MQEVSIKKYIKYYIRRKLKVFPCKGNGKSPRISGWQESATLDEKVIDRWWEKYPNANIGLLTGKNNNLVVVDVDINNGKKGMESLKQLQNECGEFDTLMVHFVANSLALEILFLAIIVYLCNSFLIPDNII